MQTPCKKLYAPQAELAMPTQRAPSMSYQRAAAHREPEGELKRRTVQLRGGRTALCASGQAREGTARQTRVFGGRAPRETLVFLHPLGKHTMANFLLL